MHVRLNLSAQLLKSLKVRAAKEGLSLQDTVVVVLEQALQQEALRTLKLQRLHARPLLGSGSCSDLLSQSMSSSLLEALTHEDESFFQFRPAP